MNPTPCPTGVPRKKKPRTGTAGLLRAITDPSRFNRRTYDKVLREERAAHKAVLARLKD